ncbi:hypothetical protein [Natrinema ejinorense]|uniref:Uncharacterized protein n=1 Tax=Natrinema ejinorense TaxID=373386 RepID=A0A2A5QP91_9EURY|nr:hypothetical protein [Natrinema ejinorense]PCR88647.1 hypothetical protein CP557_21690 [Natrinema ejinorense]
MSETDDLPPVWDMHDLPPVEADRNVAHADDWYPTPDGHVRAYFNDDLMMSLSGEQFAIGFDGDFGAPSGLVFQSPTPMFEADDPHEPSVTTLMTEEEIPIEERPTDAEHERVFGPTEAVTWDFEIRLETTPYEP